MEESIARVYRFKKVLKYSILSLLIAIIGLLVFDYFRVTPNNVYFTNISSNSITVSWDTKIKTDATAIYVDSNSKLPFLILPIFKDRFFDTRDITKAELEATQQSIENEDGLEVSMDDIVTKVSILDRGKYYTHHVEIKGLEPEKEYSFMVGDSIVFRKVKDVNNETVAKTYTVPESILRPVPAYGAVRDSMNQNDIPIEDMAVVDDGIIYFNFYDKVTGERSSILSSPLNKSGNWYIDTSSAIDSEGNNFYNTYSGGEDGYIYAELKLNGGNQGLISRTDNAGIISPANTIILHTSILELQHKTITLFSPILDKLIKGVSASGSCGEGKGSCTWVTWCDYECRASDGSKYYYIGGTTPPNSSCTQSGSEWKCSIKNDCPEQKETLEARNCEGYEGGEQENDFCSDGTKAGAKPHFEGTVCRECNYHGEQYAHWGTVDKSKCESNTDNTKEKICEENGLGTWKNGTCNCANNSHFKNSPGICLCNTTYEMNDKHICVLSIGACTKDGSIPTLDNKTKNVYCSDCDGCYCSTSSTKKNGKGYVESKSTCKKESDGEEKDDDKTQISENGYCSDPDGCKCQLGAMIDVKQNDYCSDGKAKYPKSSGVCTDADGCMGCTEGYLVKIDTMCTITSSAEDQPNENVYCWNEKYYTSQKCIGDKCYYCSSSGDWVELDYIKYAQSCYDLINNLRNHCDNQQYYCKVGNELFKCNFQFKLWMKVDSKKTIATDVIRLKPGQKCDVGKECECIGGINDGKKFIGHNKPRYCLEVDGSCNSSSKNKVCDISGKKCQLGSELNKNLNKYEGRYTDSKWYCASQRNKTSSLINNIVVSVYAEDVPTYKTYIIDQKTGLISGLEEGVYSFENNGQTYFFDISEESLIANNGNAFIFIDKNDNGEYDEGTDTKISTLGAQIQITTIQKSYKYSLKEGFNFVSFPFVVAYDDYRTAASLLKQLNSVYGDSIYSISKYDGSWKIVGQNVELYSNNDFQLIPGQGYVIKAKSDVDIVIPGKPVKYETEEDSAPVTLLPGWNLIGIYGSNVKKYTAKSMLQDINAFETVDFTANNVSTWESDVQRYQGFQLETENGVEMEYGFDYTIELLKSYFVRVENGSGNWQPELAK